MEIYLPYRAIYSPAYHFAAFLIATPSSLLLSATCFSLDLFLLPLNTGTSSHLTRDQLENLFLKFRRQCLHSFRQLYGFFILFFNYLIIFGSVLCSPRRVAHR